MNDGIQITPAELRNSASEMINKIEAMRTALTMASTVMDNTRDSFEATSADALRDKYTELRGKFDKFYEKMTSYATFLETTASYYERADENITKAANDVLQS